MLPFIVIVTFIFILNKIIAHSRYAVADVKGEWGATPQVSATAKASVVEYACDHSGAVRA